MQLEGLTNHNVLHLLFAMYAEVFYLVEGDGLVLRRPLIRGAVAFGIRSEGSKVHFASRNGSNGVNLKKVINCRKLRILVQLNISNLRTLIFP